MSRRPIRSLLRDKRGAYVVEAAMVLPVLCLFCVGAFDIAHELYMRSTLEGIVQKTGRDSGLEAGIGSAAQAATDAKVRAQVIALANGATVTFTRRFYRTFSQAAAARFEGRDVPRPPHWGGYRVSPERIEFWRDREHRLHERRLFTPDGSGSWREGLLFP